MYQKMCDDCGQLLSVPLGMDINKHRSCDKCLLDVLGSKVTPSVGNPPQGLRDEVKSMARDIFVRTVSTELHRCNQGSKLVEAISRSSIEAAKAYFKVEDNV